MRPVILQPKGRDRLTRAESLIILATRHHLSSRLYLSPAYNRSEELRKYRSPRYLRFLILEAE